MPSELYQKWAEFFAPHKIIALAISGGSDSVFMLHKIHEFSKQNGKKIIVLTVNHNLREEAKSECEFVEKQCKKLGIDCKILEWIHDGISTNIHDKARKARYDLMTDYCHKNKIGLLCTAHHMDDRIENFFIRIYRGSGILGLVDKEQITYNKTMIFRPIFDISKNEILKYLGENNIDYVNDSSNEDSKYLRANIRNWISKLPSELDPNLFKKRVISVKSNLERAAEIIQKIYGREMQNNVKIFDEGYAQIDKISDDKEVSYMVFAEVLKTISGSDNQVRLESLKELHQELSNNEYVKKTLSGCIIEKKDGKIIIYREFGKAPPKDIELENGAIWDGRFVALMSYPEHSKDVIPHSVRDPKNNDMDPGQLCFRDDSSPTNTPLQISYLKESEYSEIKDKISLEGVVKINKKIIFTLPVVKYLEKVIAIPHINYYDDAYDNLKNQLSFEFKRINNE